MTILKRWMICGRESMYTHMAGLQSWALLMHINVIIWYIMLITLPHHRASLILQSVTQIKIKIMLFNPSPRCCLLWKSLAGWRTWRSWLSSLHSSSVSAHSGPGSLDGSTQLPSDPTDEVPHTPVMLKEVLHYLDIQQGQVGKHVCCFCL